MLAVACGLAVANLYYAQPLLDAIASSYDVRSSAASVVLVMTQLGYAAGMVLLAPLGDLLENRRLAARVLLASAVALGLAAAAPTLHVFLAASLAVGATSVVAQILVPVAAHLAPEANRGQVVGRVMSGLLLGILLARTVSSFLTAAFGWRSVYAISAVLMLLLSAALTRLLPRRQPAPGTGYGRLLASLLTLVRTEPVLRRRALYQALMFAAFSVFWTGIASELSTRHGFSQTGIGLFALVGAAGAAAAPLAGRLGDRGRSGAVTGGSFALAAASLVLAALAEVERLPVSGARVQGGEYGGGDVVDVSAGPQQVARADRHLSAAGADPTQHEVLPELLVVRAVHQRKSECDGAAGQPALLDIELVVVVRDVRQPGAAVGVALAAQLGVLCQRHCCLDLVGPQPDHGLVHVLAGQHHGGHLGQGRQDRLDVGSGQGVRIDHGVGREGANLLDMRAELSPVGVQVLHRHPCRGLGAAAMHNQDLVATLVQPLHDPPADEPGTSKHKNAHDTIHPFASRIAKRKR